MPPLSLPDPPLADAHVRLRELREADLPAVVAACQDPLLPRFLTAVEAPYGEADAREWMALLAPAREAGTSLQLVIADQVGDALLGAVGLAELDWTHRRGAVGYWLAPGARGRGHAAAAVRLLAAHAFATLELQKLELLVEPENRASQQVAERCGFVREGLLRAHMVNNGARCDVYAYGLLPDELRGG